MVAVAVVLPGQSTVITAPACQSAAVPVAGPVLALAGARPLNCNCPPLLLYVVACDLRHVACSSAGRQLTHAVTALQPGNLNMSPSFYLSQQLVLAPGGDHLDMPGSAAPSETHHLRHSLMNPDLDSRPPSFIPAVRMYVSSHRRHHVRPPSIPFHRTTLTPRPGPYSPHAGRPAWAWPAARQRDPGSASARSRRSRLDMR